MKAELLGARPRDGPSPKIADGTACRRFSTLPRGKGWALRLGPHATPRAMSFRGPVTPDQALTTTTAGPRNLLAPPRGPSAAAPSRLAQPASSGARTAAIAVRLPRQATRFRGWIPRPCGACRAGDSSVAGPRDDIVGSVGFPRRSRRSDSPSSCGTRGGLGASLGTARDPHAPCHSEALPHLARVRDDAGWAEESTRPATRPERGSAHRSRPSRIAGTCGCHCRAASANLGVCAILPASPFRCSRYSLPPRCFPSSSARFRSSSESRRSSGSAAPRECGEKRSFSMYGVGSLRRKSANSFA